MKSNTHYHYVFKFAFLVFGLMLLIIPVVSFISPDSITSTANGVTEHTDPSETIIFGLIGILFILIFLALKDKFAIVELGNQTIKIKQGSQERIVNWLEIEQLNQIRFVSPPLYKLKTRDSDEMILFNSQPSYISIGGYTSDLSEMGDLIKKKKRELGL